METIRIRLFKDFCARNNLYSLVLYSNADVISILNTNGRPCYIFEVVENLLSKKRETHNSMGFYNDNKNILKCLWLLTIAYDKNFYLYDRMIAVVRFNQLVDMSYETSINDRGHIIVKSNDNKINFQKFKKQLLNGEI